MAGIGQPLPFHSSYYEKSLATGEVRCIDDDIPFDIPDTWEWERWGNISNSIQYGYNAPALKNGDIRMVRISDIHDNTVAWQDVPFCKIPNEEIPNYLLAKNDILFARTGGTVGKSFLVDETPVPAIYAGYLIRTRYSEELEPLYLKSFMESPLYWKQLQSGTIATAQPNCNGKTLGKMLLPIPPKTEQNRIIAAIKKLIPILLRYKTIQAEAELMDSRLRDVLTKAILQYAIQGKLVLQQEEDGKAKDLLAAIQQEKKRLVNVGTLKKSALNTSVIFKGDDNKYYERIGSRITCIDDQIPFEIPISWRWVRLSSIADLYTGNSVNEAYKKAHFTGVKGTHYIATKDVGFDATVAYSNGIAIPNDYLPDFRIAPNGSVLMCIEGGSAGRKIAILERDVCFGNKLCCFVPFANISKFLYYYLQSPVFFEAFQSNKSGIIGGVSVNTLKELLVALPPKAEINRIVKSLDKTLASVTKH